MTVHLQVENTRRCCLAVTRGEVDIAIVGGSIPHDLQHLLQARDLAAHILAVTTGLLYQIPMPFLL